MHQVLRLPTHLTHTLLTHTDTTPIRQLISHNSSHTHTRSSLTPHISHNTSHTHSHNFSRTVISEYKGLRLPRPDSQNAAPATQKVLRLPRKSSSRCTKCCACHASAAGAHRRPSARHDLSERQSAAPATQK